VSQGGGHLKDDSKLKAALERDFGSVDAFKKKFNAVTAGIQGSGWGWLGYNSGTKMLEIVTTPNQDPLLCASLSLSLTLFFFFPVFTCRYRLNFYFKAHVPIIGIDIWEHVRFSFHIQLARYSLLLDNEGFLSPSTLLSVFEHHEHVLTNFSQYKNVKADVRSFLSAVKK
jgi:hypothetical protein